MDNNDLILLLGEMKGDIKSVLDKLETISKRQETHEKNDEERFESLNKYAASIAIVSSAIGWAASYVWNRLSGKA